jgi:hypothetical protein
MDKMREDILRTSMRFICDVPHNGIFPKERLLRNTRKVGDCWLWQGTTTSDGYGKVGINRRSWLAHRASYTMFKGPIPDGMTIDHLCQNILCVNPDHLEAVTDTENKRRSPKVQKTHCRRGHERTPENILITTKGWKQCRICKALCNRESRNRKKRG